MEVWNLDLHLDPRAPTPCHTKLNKQTNKQETQAYEARFLIHEEMGARDAPPAPGSSSLLRCLVLLRRAVITTFPI